MTSKNYIKEFEIFDNNLNLFIQEVLNTKSTLMATDEWTVKDVLCHIVFWHEAYASNYNSLANNREPKLLEGPGQELNKLSVSTLKKYSIKKLIERLEKAERSLYRSIVIKKVPRMTYKKDGHVYKTEDFLKVIAHHFVTHAKQVKRAK